MQIRILVFMKSHVVMIVVVMIVVVVVVVQWSFTLSSVIISKYIYDM